MNYTLQMFDPLAGGTGYRGGSITDHALDWTRETRAIGGYWQGDFTITPETMTRREMEAFYSNAMGRRIVERSYHRVTWEGEITQMDLTLDGLIHRRSLHPEAWHNKVKVQYVDGTTGAKLEAAWSENTESSDQYGESCYLDVVSEDYNATTAAALRDRRLAANAWPRSRGAGGMAFGEPTSAEENSLYVMCSGYVFSINRRYRETDTAAAAISAQLSTLVGESEFVTAGRIETNADTTPIKCLTHPTRLWDVIEKLVLMGDNTGASWVGGVYAGRQFVYEAAETAITHYWSDGQLLNLGRQVMPPTLIKPNIVVQNTRAPYTGVPPGGGVLDDPKNWYIAGVEFIAPNGYRLIPGGQF